MLSPQAYTKKILFQQKAISIEVGCKLSFLRQARILYYKPGTSEQWKQLYSVDGDHSLSKAAILEFLRLNSDPQQQPKQGDERQRIMRLTLHYEQLSSAPKSKQPFLAMGILQQMEKCQSQISTKNGEAKEAQATIHESRNKSRLSLLPQPNFRHMQQYNNCWLHYQLKLTSRCFELLRAGMVKVATSVLPFDQSQKILNRFINLYVANLRNANPNHPLNSQAHTLFGQALKVQCKDPKVIQIIEDLYSTAVTSAFPEAIGMHDESKVLTCLAKSLCSFQGVYNVALNCWKTKNKAIALRIIKGLSSKIQSSLEGHSQTLTLYSKLALCAVLSAHIHEQSSNFSQQLMELEKASQWLHRCKKIPENLKDIEELKCRIVVCERKVVTQQQASISQNFKFAKDGSTMSDIRKKSRVIACSSNIRSSETMNQPKLKKYRLKTEGSNPTADMPSPTNKLSCLLSARAQKLDRNISQIEKSLSRYEKTFRQKQNCSSQNKLSRLYTTEHLGKSNKSLRIQIHNHIKIKPVLPKQMNFSGPSYDFTAVKHKVDGLVDNLEINQVIKTLSELYDTLCFQDSRDELVFEHFQYCRDFLRKLGQKDLTISCMRQLIKRSSLREEEAKASGNIDIWTTAYGKVTNYFVDLGKYYTEVGQRKLAYETFTTLVNRYRDYRGYVMIGDIYERNNQFEEAIKYYSKYAEKTRNSLESKLKMANVLSKYPQTAFKSIELLNEIIFLDRNNWKFRPLNAELPFHLLQSAVCLQARNYEQQENVSRGVEICERFCRQYVNTPTVYYILGMLYQQTNDNKSAFQTFLKGLRFQPHNVELLVQIARILEERNNDQTGMTEIIQILLKALRINPRNIHVVQMLARFVCKDSFTEKTVSPASILKVSQHANCVLSGPIRNELTVEQIIFLAEVFEGGIFTFRYYLILQAEQLFIWALQTVLYGDQSLFYECLILQKLAKINQIKGQELTAKNYYHKAIKTMKLFFKMEASALLQMQKKLFVLNEQTKKTPITILNSFPKTKASTPTSTPFWTHTQLAVELRSLLNALAFIEIQSKQYDNALEALREALSLSTSLSTQYLEYEQIGKCLVAKSKLHDAKDAFKKSFKELQVHCLSLFGKMQSEDCVQNDDYYKPVILKDQEVAPSQKAEYNNYIKSYVSIALSLAFCYEYTNDGLDAKLIYKSILLVDSKCLHALNNLAAIYLMQGQDQMCLDTIELLLESHPEQTAQRQRAIEAYRSQGNIAKAQIHERILQHQKKSNDKESV